LMIGFVLSTFNSAHAQDCAVGDGGMSGGGGGVIIANPAGEKIAFETIRDARSLLVSYLYAKKLLPPSELDAFPALKQVLDAMIPIVVSTKIQKNTQSACKDKFGADKDGSIYADEANTICISTDQLGKKLGKENVFNQSMALIAHEYSHLVGADEILAVAIQKEIISDLAFNSVYSASQVVYEQRVATGSLKYKTQYPDDGGEYGTYVSSMWLTELQNKSSSLASNRLFSIFKLEDGQMVRLLQDELRLANFPILENLKAVFGSDSKASLAEVAKALSPNYPVPEFAKDYPVYKVTDQNSFTNEMIAYRDRFKKIDEAAQAYNYLQGRLSAQDYENPKPIRH
jgi:hypothetical protein